jgi:hypothetical protein
MYIVCERVCLCVNALVRARTTTVQDRQAARNLCRWCSKEIEKIQEIEKIVEKGGKEGSEGGEKSGTEKESSGEAVERKIACQAEIASQVAVQEEACHWQENAVTVHCAAVAHVFAMRTNVRWHLFALLNDARNGRV